MNESIPNPETTPAPETSTTQVTSYVDPVTGYTIERNVPMPLPRGERWPLRRLEVGDSVLIPIKELPMSGHHVLTDMGARLGIKVACRQTRDRAAIRVWRIA